jgi:hypothetical protein
MAVLPLLSSILSIIGLFSTNMLFLATSNLLYWMFYFIPIRLVLICLAFCYPRVLFLRYLFESYSMSCSSGYHLSSSGYLSYIHSIVQYWDLSVEI